MTRWQRFENTLWLFFSILGGWAMLLGYFEPSAEHRVNVMLGFAFVAIARLFVLQDKDP